MKVNPTIKDEEKIDFKKLFFKILSNWYIYAIFLIIAFVCVKLYLRYSRTIYTAYATVLVRDSKNKTSTENILEEVSLFNSSKNIDNEIGIITSYNMVSAAIQKLDFDIAYFEKGKIKQNELYKKTPFTVELISFQDKHLSAEIVLNYNDDMISLSEESTLPIQRKEPIKFGDTVSVSPGLRLVFHRNKQFSFNSERTYSFILNNIDKLVKEYANKLDVKLISEGSTFLKLQISGTKLEKEIDFLNTLAFEYVQSDLVEKNNIARNTILFIESELKEVTKSLQGAESDLKNFRQNNNLMDLSVSATNIYEQIETLNQQKADLLVRDKYYHYLLEYIEENNELNNLVAPSAMGINDNLLVRLIADLNNLYLEKSALEFSVSEENPSINTINRKIANQKATLIENVKNIIASSVISINEINRRLKESNEAFQKLPDNERELVKIQRQFSLNEHIYNYLLEKKAEIGIAQASNSPDNKIVDYAKIDPKSPPIPNPMKMYMIGFFLALLIPTGVIFAKEYFNDTIRGRDDLENTINQPIVGIIGHSNNNSPWPVLEKPKSVIAESFRSLRTNLQFLNNDKKDNTTIIGITSAMSGEGKTFCSLNLAGILALVPKKVLVIGGDMRKPRLGKELGVRMDWGLSNLLVKQATIEEVIQETSFENLFIISSGSTPPNPSELLSSRTFSDILKELQTMFDYIVIDSPPVGLVTDYFVMRQFIDVELYVVRNNYTSKSLLKEIAKNQSMKDLTKHTYYVLNDCKNPTGYGYNYGYGYYDDASNQKPGLVSRIFRRK